jgi:hypothetical protein
MWLYVETEGHYYQRSIARANKHIARMRQITDGMLNYHRPDELEVNARSNLSLGRIDGAMQLDPSSSAQVTPPAPARPRVPTVPTVPTTQQIFGNQVTPGAYPVEADDGSDEPGAAPPADVAGPIFGQGVNTTHEPGSEGGEQP